MSKNYTQKMSILIVDDKEKLCTSLCQSFNERNYETLFALNSRDALELYGKKEFNAVILDLKVGSENGLDILKKLLKIKKIPVIMLTGHGTIESAVSAIKLGAFDYINKPVKFDKLLQIIKNATKVDELEKENILLKQRIINQSAKIITQNKLMKDIFEKATKLAASDLPVLIYGESGTGKELIADFIHSNSKKNYREMIKINCASFSDSLLDNELFGHDKGAYTGADLIYKGVFEQADGSTLFLDELGDMPLSIQVKILRTLQNHEIRRLGGKENIKINVRFIAATNKDLGSLISLNKFREDLFYRLNAAIISIPPLRERNEDIELLTRHFLEVFKRDQDIIKIDIDKEVIKTFINYNWPGNVRELKSTIQYAITVSDNNVIKIKDLPPLFFENNENNSNNSIMEKIERDLIIKTLKATKFNKKNAAKLLSMSRSSLYNKLAKYGIGIDNKK